MQHTIPDQSAWTTQKNVVFALFTRELKARFSHFRLGYVWAVGEPVAFVAILSALRMVMGRQDIAGVPYPLFFASGIIPYLFFQTLVNQSINIVSSNMALMNYKVVKPADPLVAKCILEVIIYSSSGIIIITCLAFIGFRFEWNNTMGVILVISCHISFVLGVSLIVSVAGAYIHESKKIVPILVRPLFFLSGIFYPAESLPVKYRDILLWNPLLHVSELLRESIFADYQSHEGSLRFLFTSALITLFTGIYVYRINRLRLISSGAIR